MNQHDPIRVLHVVTRMDRGGLETLIMNYFRAIDRNTIQFDFLVHRSERGDYEDEIEELGGRVHRVQKLNPFNPLYRCDLYSFLRSHPEYTIIHVHQDCMSALALKQGMRAGIPHRIAHCHSSHQDKNVKYLIKCIYKRKITHYATDLLSCSREGGEWMFETSNFQILPNAIEVEHYFFTDIKRKKYRTEFNIDEKTVVYGHVGRFDKVKNHEFLIDVFFNILNTNPHAVLILVGVGPLEASIREKVRTLKIESSVRFLGLRTDVADIYSCMDMFIFPSFYEGTPMVLIEAQAAGLPCLITDSIPDDCEITPLINRSNLEDGPEKWAERLSELEKSDRSQFQDDIRHSDFNIQFSVRRLQDYYVKLTSKRIKGE